MLTVQETLEKALSKVADSPVSLLCAGRTDAGVHACGQVVHFDTQVERSMKAWVMGANINLPHDVSVSWAKVMPAHFHARFKAIARRYRYVIYNDQIRPAHLTTGERHRRSPGRHKKRDPEGQLTNEDHARLSVAAGVGAACLYPGVSLYFSGAFS